MWDWVDSGSVAVLAHGQYASVDKAAEEEEWDVVRFLDRYQLMKSWDKLWRTSAYSDQRRCPRQLPYKADLDGH
jgi:hypothetical protein